MACYRSINASSLLTTDVMALIAWTSDWAWQHIMFLVRYFKLSVIYSNLSFCKYDVSYILTDRQVKLHTYNLFHFRLVNHGETRAGRYNKQWRDKSWRPPGRLLWDSPVVLFLAGYCCPLQVMTRWLSGGFSTLSTEEYKWCYTTNEPW